MRPSKLEKKQQNKANYHLKKTIRNMEAEEIANASAQDIEGDMDNSEEYSEEDSQSPDHIEQESANKNKGKDNNKGSRKLGAKFNPIQNIHLRYKKFAPLHAHPMKDEFDSPELLEKLRKLPAEEVKDRPKYSLGNYDTYYNYRYEKRWQDPRLKLLKKEYFLNKDCLDIGCNEGTLTIMIAIKFFPKKITGIDIDYRLINKAITNLRYFEKQQKISKAPPSSLNKEREVKNEPQPQASQVQNKPSEGAIDNEKVRQLMEKLKNFPKSFVMNMGIPTNWGHSDIEKNKVLAAPTTKLVDEMEEEKKKEEEKEKGEKMVIENAEKKPVEEPQGFHVIARFPDNVHFQVENAVKDMNVTEQYDTIMCLSTIKWIHFNWGDCGVRRVFKRVYDSLRPGGVFIFEPQEWRSYKKRKYLTQEFKETYKKIELRPNNFENYLVQRLGFKLLTKLVPDSAHVVAEGFKRSIFVFQK